MHAENGGLLATVLGIGTGEDAAYLAHQGMTGPQFAGGVHELAHLTAHIAKPCGCAKQDGIGAFKVRDCGHRHIRHGLLRSQRPHLVQYLGRQGFRYPFDFGMGAVNGLNALGRRLCHAVNVPVHRIIDN